MPREHRYFVYMLTNPSQHPFYTGMTAHLGRRLAQHRDPDSDGYTARYRLFRLVYVETYQDVYNAMDREKKLKRLSRPEKVKLIRSVNPNFDDLSREWGKPIPPLKKRT